MVLRRGRAANRREAFTRSTVVLGFSPPAAYYGKLKGSSVTDVKVHVLDADCKLASNNPN
jgi:hypothetical protein